jgi:hypothetical protein
MKRITFAAIAAALLAIIAFAEVAPNAGAEARVESQQAYLPSGSDSNGSFTVAYTLPPS